MKRFFCSILYLAILHIFALICLSLFRLYLAIDINYEIPQNIGTIAKSVAFLKGLWFDNVISCYIMILPLVTMWIANYFKTIHRAYFTACAVFASTFFTIAFIISAANVPYFEYFFTNINSSIFNWVEYGNTTTGLILGEPAYYPPIFAGIIVSVSFWFGAIKSAQFFHRIAMRQSPTPLNFTTITYITIIGAATTSLCFLGIRGRTGYNPIKVSQAYYCQDPFLNQLGINPTFNLLTSTLDDRRKENRPITLMPDDEAIATVQKRLNRNGINGISPIARSINSPHEPNHKNVVIILMESMSSHLLGTRHAKSITPFLDSLISQSVYYDNFYSSGLHTNHGIFATLYSFPTIMFRNAMKGTTIPVYSGLPTILADNGYHNIFFMTHESQYDNMNGFLRTNGFDEIYAEENYPSDKIVNSFGVQDDFLFSYAIPILNSRASTGKPFFSVLLTISNHPPYIIPQHFKPHSIKIEEQIVEFADYSISQFFEQAQRQSWFDDTIFVLLGDHGKLVGNPECEMPQACNHIPFIIYHSDITPETRHDFSSQVDVAPTILSMLGISYIQNNFGIDLRNEQRPYSFYTTDRHIAARDSSRLYIYEPAQNDEICYYISGTTLQKTQPDSIFLDMRQYCFSMLQSSQFMAKKKMTTNYPGQNHNHQD